MQSLDFSSFCCLKDHKTDYIESLLLANKIAGSGERQMSLAICEWRRESRPYYNVHPIILQSILKTDLSSVKFSDIKLPESLTSLSFRFDAKSGRKPILLKKVETGAIIIRQVDHEKGDILVRANEQNCSDPAAFWHESLKIIVGSLMLDAEFIERDMNEKDKDKPLHYFQKVGKFGWNVGANVEKEAREMGSHYRRPHLAIRWCGPKQESKPILKRIKGSIVNRSKLTEIPTGYEGAI